MDYETLTQIKRNHSGIALMNARLFPLIASFLWQSYIQGNQRVCPQDELADRLDDYLHDLRSRLGEDEFPRTGMDYLSDWSEKQGYLRKYYVEGDDVPRLELSAALEKTLGWLEGLRGRQFVGTESRLKTLFDLLRSLVEETETNVDRRLQRLIAQKQSLELQIRQAQAGDFTILSDTQVRERYAQLQDTASALLRDFGEVELNFRELDRDTRKRIAQQDSHRGEVLADIFNDADAIRESDQGQSFNAFWEFLMSLSHQESLDSMLQKVRELDALSSESFSDNLLTELKIHLMEAADKVMQTNSQLADQLRRFLDDRSRLDNRRISQLIKQNQQQLLALHAQESEVPKQDLMLLDELKLVVNAPVPYLHRLPLAIDGRQLVENADDQQASAEVLFDQVYVDEVKLDHQIRQCLAHQAAVTLQEVVAEFPLEQGLAELVAYVKLASDGALALVNNEQLQTLEVSVSGVTKEVTLPHILFTRGAGDSTNN